MKYNEMNKKTKINRLLFLTLLVMLAGTIALGYSGFNLIPPKIDFIQTSYGDEKNSAKKILVAYASHSGSTGGIADAIAKVLFKAGAAVDVRLAKKVSDLSPYQAVIVGSAIHSGEWLPEAVEFVKVHREALSRMPTAYFLASLTTVEDNEQTRSIAAAFLDPVYEQIPEVKPVDVGIFTGKLDFSKLQFMYRILWPFRGNGVSEGDYRNWEAIRDWAAGLYPKLLGL